MIKFSAQHPNGRLIFGLGLSRANCERLLAGKPIVVDLEQLGGKGEVFIMAGETELTMADQLAQFLGPDTKVTIDPRLKT